MIERELKPNGKNISVTQENKREYVDLMVKWKIERGMGEQMAQIIKGFDEALDLKMISLFDDRELELVIAGTADIDIKDWRQNTEYRSGNIVFLAWKAASVFNIYNQGHNILDKYLFSVKTFFRRTFNIVNS